MTNEERFVASCTSQGEAYVRANLSAGRFSERKSLWASNWLDQLESCKSDAARVEDRSRVREAVRPKSYGIPMVMVLLLAVLVASVAFFQNGP